MSGAAWLPDPHYAAFAIRTIRRAGELGARSEAIAALEEARLNIHDDRLRSDIDEALSGLGHRAVTRAKPRPKSRSTTSPVLSVEDLVIGICYQRRALHEAGLGGNRQKGISYPADGTYVLLFSDPSKVSDYGYKDQPVGDDGYQYFGEWSGAGDMSMTGGNRVIVDRSPELYLFTEAPCGRMFRGRFEYVGWERQRTTRDGHELTAIVFTLHRVTTS